MSSSDVRAKSPSNVPEAERRKEGLKRKIFDVLVHLRPSPDEREALDVVLGYRDMEQLEQIKTELQKTAREHPELAHWLGL